MEDHRAQEDEEGNWKESRQRRSNSLEKEQEIHKLSMGGSTAQTQIRVAPYDAGLRRLAIGQKAHSTEETCAEAMHRSQAYMQSALSHSQDLKSGHIHTGDPDHRRRKWGFLAENLHGRFEWSHCCQCE